MSTRRRTGRLAGAGMVATVALLLAACGSEPADETTEPAVGLPTNAATQDTSTPPPAGAVDDHDDADDAEDAAEDAREAADVALVVGPAGTVDDHEADLDVEDQRGDGSSVLVEEVEFSGSRALVGVYDAGGNVIGSMVVQPGDHLVTLRLDRTLGSSQRLVAALLRDANDNGVIDDGDPVLADEGEPVIEDFDLIVG